MQQNYKYILKSIVKNIKIFPGKKKKSNTVDTNDIKILLT